MSGITEYFCLPLCLRTDILRTTDALAEFYHDDGFFSVNINARSRDLKAKIIRIKGDPDIEYVFIYAFV